MAENRIVSIVRRFEGLYDTKRSKPNPESLGGFLAGTRVSQGGPLPVWKKELVIRDEQSFHRFVDDIPKRVMDFVPDPPPSSDPLLRRPTIDFEMHMLLVILAHDPNRLVHLEIKGIELTPGSMKVDCRYDEPGLFAQKVVSFGTYQAAVVNRFDGSVEFSHT